jgi:hypothetical protein
LEENALLTAEYSVEEVRKAVFQMDHNKPPGLDGFSAKFYQIFWDTIKSDLLDLLVAFMLGN